MGCKLLLEMWNNRFLPARSLGDLIGIDGGTLDPPTFFYDIAGEVFTKSKAHFVGDIRAAGHFETFPGYETKIREEKRLKGSD